MRRLTALAIAALVLAACGGATTITDPYQIVDKSASATYDLVQVNVGVAATGSGSPVAIDPSAIQLIADKQSGKAAIHLQLPVSQLGADAAGLAQFGITGDSLDLDIVFDGDALYAKGPVLTTLLTMLMTQGGLTPGDLSGWMRLGTKAEFEALAASLGGQLGGAMPSAAPVASHDAASIKAALDSAGITLTYVGAEKRGNKDAAHLSVAVDVSKLEANPAFSNVPTAQLGTIKDGLAQLNVAADVWVDSSSYRLVEADLHLTPKDGSSGKTDVTILVSTPTDTSALTAPSTFTPVPLSQLVTQLLQTFGQGLLAQ